VHRLHVLYSAGSLGHCASDRLVVLVPFLLSYWWLDPLLGSEHLSIMCRDHSLVRIRLRRFVGSCLVLTFHPHPLLGARYHSVDTTPGILSREFLLRYARSRLFLVRSSSRPSTGTGNRIVYSLHHVRSDFQSRLFIVVTTTAPRWRL
jgi:hypothetical protein